MLQRLFRVFLFGLVAGLLLLGGIWAGLQTEYGRTTLLRAVEYITALTSPIELELEGLGSGFPGSVRLERLELADANGTWMAAESIGLDWDWSALWHGRLHGERLFAREIVWYRPPQTPPDPEQDAPPWWLLSRLSLDSLSIPKLTVAGDHPAALAVKGQFDGRPETLRANLAAKALQGKDTLQLNGRFTPEQAAYELTLETTAEAQGPLARLTRLPGPWHGRLQANGTRRRGSGTARFEGEHLGQATVDYKTIPEASGVRTTLQGRMAPAASVVPSTIAPWLAPGVDLRLTMVVPELVPSTLQLESFELRSPEFNLDASGSWQRKQRQWQSQVALGLDLGPATPPQGLMLPDTLHISGDLSGSFAGTTPSLRCTLDTDPTTLAYNQPGDLRKLTLHNSTVSLTAESTTLTDWRARVIAAGNLEGDSKSGPTTPLSCLGELRTEDRLLWTIPTASLRLDDTEALTLEGRFNTKETTAEGHLSLTPEVLRRLPLPSKVAPFLPQGMVTTSFSGRGFPLDLQGQLKGDLSWPLLPARIRRLGGAHDVALLADWGWHSPQQLRLDNLDISTPSGRVWGGGTLNTASQRFAARLNLSLESTSWPAGNLAVSTAPLSATLDATGAVTRPVFDFRLDCPRMRVGNLPALEAIHAETRLVADARGIAGPLALQARLGQDRTELRSAVAWRDSVLSLTNLNGQWGDSSLTGKVRWPSPNGLPSASLSLDAVLGELAQYATLPVKGRLQADLDIAERPENQKWAQLDFTCQDAGWGPQWTAQRLEGQLALDAPEPPLRGSGSLNLTEVTRGSWRIDTGRLAAQGSLADLAFTSSLKGHSGVAPFALSSSGLLTKDDTATRVRLDSFNGTATPRLPFRLAETARLSKEPDKWTLTMPHLNLGPGKLTLEAKTERNRVEARLSGHQLPLAGLNPFVPWSLAGSITTRADLTGTLQSPRLQGTLAIKDSKIRQGRWREVPTLEAEASWDWRPGTFQAKIGARQASNGTLNASVSLPLDLTLAPFTIAPQPAGACRGSLSSSLSLDFLPRVFNADGVLLQGQLATTATLDGTWERPDIQAEAAMDQGHLEHVYHGIVLEEIAGRCELDTSGISELRLTATDGAKGNLTLEGTIPLQPEPRADLRARFEQMALVRKDQLEATASGTVDLSGPFSSPRLTGSATLERTEIRIPEQLPPSVTGVEIVEVNAPQEETSAGSSRSRPPAAIDLDLELDIPRRFFVRGRGLEAEFKGGCQVTGTTRKPRLQGELEAVWGRFTFFSKTLTIETGQLFFEQRSPPAPRINVAAVNRQDDFLARIWLTGKIDDPGIRMESEPALPQEEILGRVLFGRSITTLTPLQALQLAQALRALSTGQTGGSLTTRFFEKTRRLLELDEFGVTGGNGGPSLGMGKYIQDNVYIRAQKGLESEEDKIEVEVELSPHTSVESQVGGQGRSGVSLNWKLDY